nr:uncharacterized protein LOC129380617 isoform X2 [Dermacentor andersoni]
MQRRGFSGSCQRIARGIMAPGEKKTRNDRTSTHTFYLDGCEGNVERSLGAEATGVRRSGRRQRQLKRTQGQEASAIWWCWKKPSGMRCKTITAAAAPESREKRQTLF